MISAGDQVNKTGKPKEEEYASYLSANALASLPVATTIGNHDSLNADYAYHFNNPNNTENGKTAAGGDYYSYGQGLFIVLNTNNYNVAEHQKTIEEAVAAYPDAAWHVVTIHQDIYGSGLDHSDTDGMILVHSLPLYLTAMILMWYFRDMIILTAVPKCFMVMDKLMENMNSV